MSYLNSVTLIGFVGSDPQQYQAKRNSAKMTVLSVATRRSWKNAEDEWASKTEWHRIAIFRPQLAQQVASTVKKGSHIAVTGELVSSSYERPSKSKKSAPTKITSWSIRANTVRKLDRKEPEATASGSNASSRATEPSDASPF